MLVLCTSVLGVAPMAAAEPTTLEPPAGDCIAIDPTTVPPIYTYPCEEEAPAAP
jgi:hypothetical protein